MSDGGTIQGVITWQIYFIQCQATIVNGGITFISFIQDIYVFLGFWLCQVEKVPFRQNVNNIFPLYDTSDAQNKALLFLKRMYLMVANTFYRPE